MTCLRGNLLTDFWPHSFYFSTIYLKGFLLLTYIRIVREGVKFRSIVFEFEIYIIDDIPTESSKFQMLFLKN